MKTLETNRLLLRSLRREDAEKIEELAGDYEVAKTTLSIPHPYPQGSAVDFIENSLQAEKKGEYTIFAIVEKDMNHLIGIINISTTPAHERGELGYWIGKPYWGMGYGTEATRLMISYAFETFSLNKIFARAVTHNPGSWRIMEKVGMTHEGIFKQHEVRWGKYLDITCYGVLRKDFQRR